jgi:hypothetical protein
MVPMDSDAMLPYGLALLAYLQGETGAQLVVRRDDGVETPLAASHFFRPESELSPIELAALDLCRGYVLDIGGGSGLHSLVLQSRGLEVTAIDIDPLAVEVMGRRGVRDARTDDVFQFRGGPFDTLLVLGHGIGMVEDLHGLERFLSLARRMIRGDGQLLLDSLDVRRTYDPRHLAYHATNREAGRYFGETRIQMEYRGRRGPYCGWLHVDRNTLEERGRLAGWKCDTVLEQESGEYLARLSPDSPD